MNMRRAIIVIIGRRRGLWHEIFRFATSTLSWLRSIIII